MARKSETVAPSDDELALASEGDTPAAAVEETPAATEAVQEPERPSTVRLLATRDVAQVTHDGVAYTVDADGAISVPAHIVAHLLPHGFTQLHEA